MVNAVCVVPLGAHPGGVWNQGIEQCEAYAEDYEFMTDFNRISKEEGGLDTWIREWVLDCDSFEEYRKKLGRDRVLRLKGNADRDSWRYQLDALEDRISEHEESNDIEGMVVAAARELKERILRSRHKTMLAGAGTANLAAWLARYQLQKEDYLVELLVELGYFGNSPRPAEPFLLNFGNFATCKMLTETLDTLGVFTCGSQNRCIGVLGGGQIDKFGNINSHWVSDDLYITGSGGANDVATGARETMVIMQQSRRRFLERVPFVTAPGERVRTLVSTMGVFEKPEGENEFVLTKFFARRDNLSKDEIIKNIKDNCGWNLKISRQPLQVPLPLSDELRLLRVFDPEKYYLK
jgi:acyl CoA:acetate/3-ketoacid CoA transferase beta subunit